MSVDPGTGLMNITDTGTSSAPWTGLQSAAAYVRLYVVSLVSLR